MQRTSGLRGMVLAVAFMLATGCTQDGAGKMPRNPLSTPEETVKAFCDLDARGERLSSATWSKVLPYIGWSEEAGWDRVVVIEGYRVLPSERRSQTMATVTVEYQVLGVLSGAYDAVRKSETVLFSLEMTDRGWKIMGPDTLQPYVLAKYLAQHLEQAKSIEQAEQVRKDTR